MTYWLLGTIICTTLFILTRFTSFQILEEQDDSMFKKSPNLAKLGVMTVAKSATIKLNSIDSNGKDNADAVQNGAKLLLDEIVTKAASAAINKSQLQMDFELTKK